MSPLSTEAGSKLNSEPFLLPDTYKAAVLDDQGDAFCEVAPKMLDAELDNK